MKKIFILVCVTLILLTACEKGDKAIESAINDGDFEKAETLLREKIDKNQEDADLYTQLADLFILEYFATFEAEEFLTPLSSNWEFFPSLEFTKKVEFTEALNNQIQSAKNEDTARLQYFLLCYDYYRYKYHNDSSLIEEMTDICKTLLSYNNMWADNALLWKYFIEADMSLSFDIDKFCNELEQYPDSELNILKDLDELIPFNEDEFPISRSALKYYKEITEQSSFDNVADSVLIQHQIKRRLVDTSIVFDDKIELLDAIIDLMLSKGINHYCMWEKGKIIIDNNDYAQAELIMKKVIEQQHSNYERSALKKELAGYAYKNREFGSVISLLKQIEELAITDKINLWKSLLEIEHEADADAMYDEMYREANTNQKRDIERFQYKYDLSKLIVKEVDYWTAGEYDIGVSCILENKSRKTYKQINVKFYLNMENGKKASLEYLCPILYPETKENISLLSSKYTNKPLGCQAKAVSFKKAD